MDASILKTVWKFLRKLGRELPYDPTTPLLVFIQRIQKHYFKKYMCTAMFIAALFTKAKIWELLNILHMHTHTHTHTMECYSTIKR